MVVAKFLRFNDVIEIGAHEISDEVEIFKLWKQSGFIIRIWDGGNTN